MWEMSLVQSAWFQRSTILTLAKKNSYHLYLCLAKNSLYYGTHTMFEKAKKNTHPSIYYTKRILLDLKDTPGGKLGFFF